MTETPKNEPSQETDTARSQDNVVRVDFAAPGVDKTALTKYVSKPDVIGDVGMQIYFVEETNVVGLEFSQPVKEFRMDLAGVDALVEALASVLVKTKGKDPS